MKFGQSQMPYILIQTETISGSGLLDKPLMDKVILISIQPSSRQFAFIPQLELELHPLMPASPI